MDLFELLKREFVFLDGAAGTELVRRRGSVPEHPEDLNVDEPGLIEDIHKSYIDAGSDIIYTFTFGANRYKLSGSKYSVNEVIKAACENAGRARKGTDALVALDIGPTGRMMHPNGDMTFEEAYSAFKEMIEAADNYDLIVIETMTDLYEMRAALLAAKEHTDLPVMCSMTFEESMRTFSGTAISSAAVTLEGMGADVMGVNCSLGPDAFKGIIDELSKWTTLPILAKPNAGMPDPVTGEYKVLPHEFAEKTKELIPYGVRLVGGCCGTSPEYIKELRKAFDDEKHQENSPDIPSCVCSSEKIVLIDRPVIAGERINPTGKKEFKEAVRSGDLEYAVNIAIEEENEGADILDVNLGVPGIDEPEVLKKMVLELSGRVRTPLQIDSSDPKALEEALRVYAGKAIINSVNGNKASMDAVLPIAKKYGAAIIALTLDEDGIPKTVEKRVEIAGKIINEAEKYGISRKDIYVDCLTLTVSAEPAGAMMSLDALSRIKKEFGVKTALGISNISFGLPSRSVVNSAFLQMALSRGLDIAIIDPSDELMIRAMDTNALISGIDENCASFIEKYSNREESSGDKKEHDLKYLVENGLSDEFLGRLAKMLEGADPFTIISDTLIPIMDSVGRDFEKGRIFIPQLLISAKTAKSGFDLVNSRILKKDSTDDSAVVVTATVKGDVHDIGKNIAKIVMGNYGLKVIDLGKNVDPSDVLDAVISSGAKVLGLSALMTTTLPGMEETVRLVKEKAPSCRIMVGGAVVTEEYAEKIGADKYVKDAVSSSDFAKSVYSS